MNSIPLAKPWITETDVAGVARVLGSDRLSLGPVKGAFEDALAKRVDRRFAVAVNSGTSALHLIIRGLGIGPGDEVITTPFSFVASTNCILMEGAMPVFVDIDPNTLCVAPEHIEKAITSRTKAILAVDVFGHPADWPRLEAIAKQNHLLLIEDSAESLGSTLHGRPCGSFGAAAIFGFYPNKQITTGEGGMLVTDDAGLASLARSMSDQGRGEGGWLNHRRLGFNYRMDELSASLGVTQLDRLDEIVSARSQVAGWYEGALDSCDDVILPAVSPDVGMSWFVYVIQLATTFTRDDRDRVLERLRAEGVGCRDYFQPIHLQPFIQEQLGTTRGDYPVTESVGDRAIALPFFPEMTHGQVEKVAESLRRAIRE